MKTVLALLILATIDLNARPAQETSIGTLTYFRPGEKQVLFIDGDLGEVSSFATFDEEIWAVTVNEETGIFYAMSRNNLYKYDLESGEKMDEYQFMEVLEKTETDLIDPNLNITPYGVSKEGIAIFVYNEELFELSKKQQDVLNAMGSTTSMSEITRLSNESEEILSKITPMYTQQEASIVNFNSRTTQTYGTFNFKGEMLLGISSEGQLQTYDVTSTKFFFKNLETQEVEREVDASGMFDQVPGLKQLSVNSRPTPISDYILLFSFPGANMDGVNVLYDTKNEEFLDTYTFNSPMEATYPLFYKDSEKFLYASKSCAGEPMPSIPDFGEPSGTSKKKIAAWEEEMEKKNAEYESALKKWQDNVTNPENCQVTIFSDKEKTQKVMELPKTSYALIYDDAYALVTRNFEMTLYEIETGKVIWVIDIDF